MDNKLRIKTVSVVAGTETLVEMPHSHAYIRNIGEEKVYASTSPNITPYDDGVIEVKPNRTKVLANIFDVKKGVGEIYLLSVGDTVCEIESTNVLNFSETVEGGDGSSSGSGSGENGKDGRGILKITFLSSTGGDVAGIEGAVDTYQITYTDGTKSTYDVTNGSKGIDGKQGISIVNVSINDSEHLIIELSDGSTQDIGKLPQSDVDLTNYYTINEANDKINTEIQSSLENYVQKDGSKVLSTNDYTTVEKTKLANLTNYDDTEIKNNITAIRTTVDKKVDKVDGYSLVLDSEIEKLSAITNPIKVKGRVDTIDVLPNDATVGDLYFVGTEDSEDYKEYVLTESREWEQIGVSKVDLSVYVLKEDGKSLVSDTEITRLANVHNYDDTNVKAQNYTASVKSATNTMCCFKFDASINRFTAKFLMCGNNENRYADIFINVCFNKSKIKKYIIDNMTTIKVIKTEDNAINIVFNVEQYTTVTCVSTVPMTMITCYSTSTLPTGTEIVPTEL